MLRHARLALILVAALIAMGLSASGDLGGHESSGDASFTVRWARADGSLTRWTGNDRRESNSDRSLRQRLVLFAAMAALLAGVHLRRNIVMHVVVRRPTTTWWSPHAARSPPSFSSSIT